MYQISLLISLLLIQLVKGIVGIVLSDHPSKEGYVWFTTIPCNRSSVPFNLSTVHCDWSTVPFDWSTVPCDWSAEPFD